MFFINFLPDLCFLLSSAILQLLLSYLSLINREKTDSWAINIILIDHDVLADNKYCKSIQFLECY